MFPLSAGPPSPPPPAGIAPLLKKLMADYAATGLPPAYIPKNDDDGDVDDDNNESER